jgi:hypothetical protein
VAPNVCEPLGKPDWPGKRVFEREAQNPIEAGAVGGGRRHGTFSAVTQGDPRGSARAVDREETTTTGRRPRGSRISP